MLIRFARGVLFICGFILACDFGREETITLHSCGNLQPSRAGCMATLLKWQSADVRVGFFGEMEQRNVAQNVSFRPYLC
jgi:hypothetical protein